MINENSRLLHNQRGTSPCDGCTERFRACSDRCPKDERGEFGYKAWKAEGERVNRSRKEYMEKRVYDFKRRETWGIKK